MHRTLRDLEDEVLQLPTEARGELAAKLLESLEPADDEIRELWIHEAEARAQELRNGEASGEPVDRVLARIRVS